MSKKPIRILLADDHNLVREALVEMLNEEEGFEVVEQASDGQQAIALGVNCDVDVAILDINMPKFSGVEVCKDLKACKPDLPILALTMQNETHIIKEMLSAGASGYMLKNSDKTELVKAITSVTNGGHYYSKEASDVVMGALAARKQSKLKNQNLTLRELDVLKLIMKQESNKEIADALSISIKTVDVHKRNLIEKTASKNVVGLALYALENLDDFGRT